jgi:hypothetical protein
VSTASADRAQTHSGPLRAAGDVDRWLKTAFHLGPKAAAEHVQVLTRGLDVLLGRYTAPMPTLDLDALYKEAHAFLRQLTSSALAPS